MVPSDQSDKEQALRRCKDGSHCFPSAYVIAMYCDAKFPLVSSHEDLRHVCGDVNLVWKYGHINFKPGLHFFQYARIFFGRNKCDCKTFGTKTTRATNSMKILIRFIRHIVIEDDIYSLKIDTTTENISGYKNSTLVLLELVVPVQPVQLWKTAVYIHRREILLNQQTIELLTTSGGIHKN